MHWVAVACLISTGGCAEQQPPQTATVATPKAKGTGEAPPEPPLVAAKAPAHLVVVGRARRPAEALDLLSTWVSSPVDWRRLLSDAAGDVLSVLHQGAPLDVALALTPDAQAEVPVAAAFSVPLLDRDRAAEYLRKQGLEVSRKGAYAYRVGEETPCAIVRALGEAPARLVCSESPEGLELLVPYMSRGLPTEKLSEATLFLDARLGVVRERYGRHASAIKLAVPFVLQEARTGNSAFDATFAEAVRALADEAVAWTNDLEGIRVEGWLRQDRQQLEIRSQVAFRAAESWVAQSWQAAAGRQGVAPDSFWELPKDASMASYSVAGDPSRVEGIARVVSEMSEAALGHFGVNLRRAASFGTALRDVLLVPGPVVFASGAIPSAEVEPGSVEADVQGVREAVGYTLLGLVGDDGRALAMLDQSLSAYDDPSMRAYLKRQGADVRYLPAVARRRVPAAARLPAGSVEFTATLPKIALEDIAEGRTLKGVKAPQGYVVVMQAGPVTWIGAGMDEAELFRRMGDLTRDGEPTLGERQGLESFREQPAVGAGFSSIATYSERGGGLLEAIAPEIDESFDVQGFRAVTAQSLPNGGKAPIISRLTATSAGPKATHEVTVSRGTFEDVAVLVASFVAAIKK